MHNFYFGIDDKPIIDGISDRKNIDIIKNQSTAHSVDKVIEEIEKANQGCCIYCGCDLYSDDVIEIVKHGGISDNVCEWRLTDIRKLMSYETSCGNEDLYDYSYKYCPYCGKKIKVVE